MMLRLLIVLVALGASALAPAASADVFVIKGPGGYSKIVNVPDPPKGGNGVPQGSAARRSQVWPHVELACKTHGVDPRLVDLMIRMESGYNVRAVSNKGARGLMQLMPGTAALYGVGDSFDPVDNVRGGVRYFRDLLTRFGSDVRLALAAYNAGPEAVARYRGVPPYRETRNYVAAILTEYRGAQYVDDGTRPSLTGGFGRASSRPVTVSAGGGAQTISNASSEGEAVVERKLALR